MIAYAAVDVRLGRAVQLVGGDVADERIALEDPVAVACSWVSAGFTALHVVDLDAATGAGSNRDTITSIITAAGVPVQVGGGLRSTEAVAYWIGAGAAKVVLGTRAVRDPSWLRDIARSFPDRVIVAADVRNGSVATHGWQEDTALTIDTYLEGLEDLPLDGVLVTDIDREGRMQGPDIPLFSRLARTTRLPLIASGGITSPADLDALADAGVAGAVLGMALYTGAFFQTSPSRSIS